MARGLRVTYRRSCIGYRARHRATLRSLGLRRLGDSRILPDNSAVRGMVRQVAYMLEVEPVELPEPAAAGQAGDGPAGDGRGGETA